MSRVSSSNLCENGRLRVIRSGPWFQRKTATHWTWTGATYLRVLRVQEIFSVRAVRIRSCLVVDAIVFASERRRQSVRTVSGANGVCWDGCGVWVEVAIRRRQQTNAGHRVRVGDWRHAQAADGADGVVAAQRRNADAATANETRLRQRSDAAGKTKWGDAAHRRRDDTCVHTGWRRHVPGAGHEALVGNVGNRSAEYWWIARIDRKGRVWVDLWCEFHSCLQVRHWTRLAGRITFSCRGDTYSHRWHRHNATLQRRNGIRKFNSFVGQTQTNKNEEKIAFSVKIQAEQKYMYKKVLFFFSLKKNLFFQSQQQKSTVFPKMKWKKKSLVPRRLFFIWPNVCFWFLSF